MEEKKYEAGRVEISSAEYRDLVKEAVEANHSASEARSEKWRLESEKNKLSKELEEANKKISELESILANLQVGISHGATPAPNNDPWWSRVTCSNLNNSNNKENN